MYKTTRHFTDRIGLRTGTNFTSQFRLTISRVKSNTVLPRLERPSRLVRHTEYYAPILKEQRKSAPSRSVRPNEKNISVQPLKVAGIILNFIKASLCDDFLPH